MHIFKTVFGYSKDQYLYTIYRNPKFQKEINQHQQ